MLRSAELVAFVASTDGARARRFYQEVLGLRLVEETAYALVFDAAGTTLRVTFVEQVGPAPHTVLGWSVDDIQAIVADLVAQGVDPERYPGLDQDEAGVWRSPGGARVAWFKDPDGNVLSLTQG